MLFQRHMYYSVKLYQSQIHDYSYRRYTETGSRQEICPSFQEHGKHTKQASWPQRNTGIEKLQAVNECCTSCEWRRPMALAENGMLNACWEKCYICKIFAQSLIYSKYIFNGCQQSAAVIMYFCRPTHPGSLNKNLIVFFHWFLAARWKNPIGFLLRELLRKY